MDETRRDFLKMAAAGVAAGEIGRDDRVNSYGAQRVGCS